MSRLWLDRSWVPFLGVVAALTTIGCGADHSDPAADGTGGSGHEGGAGSDIHLPPVPQTGNCTTGVVQECTVYYESGGIQNCFVGVQLCVEGSWDTCTDQETVDELIAELGYDDVSPGDEAAGGAGGSSG